MKIRDQRHNMENMALTDAITAVNMAFIEQEKYTNNPEELRLNKYLVLAWLPSITSINIDSNGVSSENHIFIEFNGNDVHSMSYTHIKPDDKYLYAMLRSTVINCYEIMEKKVRR